MMQGAGGLAATNISAANRKAASVGAATGRGAGLAGSLSERAMEAEREREAMTLAGTYAPSNLPLSTYAALQGGDTSTSILKQLGMMGPYAMLPFLFGGNS
jgi:hypothetical protein